MPTTDELNARAAQLETRAIAVITAVAGALGYLWLQNNYDTVMRQQEEIAHLRDSIAATYATHAEVKVVDDRISRIESRVEGKVDRIIADHLERFPDARMIPPPAK